MSSQKFFTDDSLGELSFRLDFLKFFFMLRTKQELHQVFTYFAMNIKYTNYLNNYFSPEVFSKSRLGFKELGGRGSGLNQ